MTDAVERTNGDRKESEAPELSYRRVVNDAQLEDIVRLRYRCYRREGMIDPLPEPRFADRYDEDPNVFIFGVELEGALVASLRIHVASPEMPFCASFETFPEILGAMLDRGESFVDPTRFVVDRTFRRAMAQIPFATVRLAAMAAEHFQTTHVLATVRAEHAPFYRRFCDMEVLAPPRQYQSLKRPLGLLAGRSEEISRSVYPRHPHFASTHRERVKLFGLSRQIGLGMNEPPALNDNGEESWHLSERPANSNAPTSIS
ncbi:N-acyl amino acid synthase FeeM domain-containing protein [Aureimonas populi]|uniref:Acyl-homoserine-lactone synthase n=1 Tax=Aureimonas populi TaxID=1701758 RepID=A0ABW5CJZ5_9HYPH|nr:acyl-homoserine-lactone synthase [Aureimonas populi]